MRRALDSLPRQGSRKPWRLNQNYALDLLARKFGAVGDGTMELTPAPGGSEAGAGTADHA